MTNNILAGDIHQKNLDKTTTNIHSRHPQTHIHVEKILFMTHEEKIVHAQRKWNHTTNEEKNIILQKFQHFQDSFDIFMSATKIKNMSENDRRKFHQIFNQQIQDWNLSDQETKNLGDLLLQALTSEKDECYQNIMDVIRKFFIIETIFALR